MSGLFEWKLTVQATSAEGLQYGTWCETIVAPSAADAKLMVETNVTTPVGDSVEVKHIECLGPSAEGI